MGWNSWYWVIKNSNKCWEHIFTVGLLEVFGHVVRDLANAVDSRVSDFRIWMSQVLNYFWHHGSDVLDVLNVLSDLGESHESRVLISPVGVVLENVWDNDWE